MARTTPAERRQSQIAELEIQLAPLFEEQRTLLGLLSGNVSRHEYREAKAEHERLRCASRGIGRRIERLSILEECERRTPKRSADILTAPLNRQRAPSACPTAKEECGYALQGGACTIIARLTVPARGGGIGTEQIPARYCLTEAELLVTSHEPLRGFEPNPHYPAGAQERDYRQTAERSKVEEIAQHYDPALVFNTAPGAVDGVPVATEDRIVLGGNGRTMATVLVYAGRSSIERGEPRQYLIEHAHEFGFDPGAVEQFERPMIVRTVRVARNERTLAEWSRRLNVSLSQQLDSTRLAVSRARFVNEATLHELAALGDDETLAAFLGSSRSRGFVRGLQSSDVIDGRAAALYVGADGLLNEKGRELVADLLVAVLIPDADLIAAYGRGPVAALARAAPALVQASQSAEYDLRPALRKATRDRITMRSSDFAHVSEFLRQGGLFAGAGPAVAGDPIAMPLLFVLDALENAPAKLTKFARRYAQLTQPGASGQGALFTAEHFTRLQAIQRAAADVGVKLP